MNRLLHQALESWQEDYEKYRDTPHAFPGCDTLLNRAYGLFDILLTKELHSKQFDRLGFGTSMLGVGIVFWLIDYRLGLLYGFLCLGVGSVFGSVHKERQECDPSDSS